VTKGPDEIEFPMFGDDRYGHYGLDTITTVTLDSQPDLFTNNVDVSPDYRYNEDKFLNEAKEYVAGTYQGHYVGGGQYQTVDIWNTLGSAGTTCRDTAIKYLMRYGKKDGYNKKDLLKAIHYITLLNHYTQEIDNDETSS